MSYHILAWFKKSIAGLQGASLEQRLQTFGMWRGLNGFAVCSPLVWDFQFPLSMIGSDMPMIQLFWWSWSCNVASAESKADGGNGWWWELPVAWLRYLPCITKYPICTAQSQHFPGPNMQSFQLALRAAAQVPNDCFQSLQESGKFANLPESVWLYNIYRM